MAYSDPLISFITSENFGSIFLPLAIIALSLGIKLASRRERPSLKQFKKEDLAIGYDVVLAAVTSFIAFSIAKVSHLTAPIDADPVKAQSRITVYLLKAFIAALLSIILLGLISCIVRWYGWEDDPARKDSLNWVGVLVPLVSGFLAMLFVAYWVRVSL